jgi:tetratricopeptide (TPR) repeat protein
MRRIFKTNCVYFLSFFYLQFILIQLSTAQNHNEIDSLKRLITAEINNDQRAEFLHQITLKFIYINSDSALSYANQFLKAAEKLNSIEYTCKAYHALADIERRRSNFEAAMSYAQQSLKKAISLNKPELLSQIYNVKANIYFSIDNYTDAIEQYEKAIEISLRNNLHDGLYMNLNNLGMIYFRQGHFEEALKVNFKSLKILDSLGVEKKRGSIYGSIGVIYQNINEFEKSYEYYEKALKSDSAAGDIMGLITWQINWAIALENQGLFDKAEEKYNEALKESIKNNFKGLEANVLCNMGKLYYRKKEISTSILYFEKALTLSESINANNLIIFCIQNLGKIYSENGNLNQAKFYLTKALGKSKEIGSLPLLRDANLALAEFYVESNDFKNAYYSYRNYTQLKDSIIGESKLKEIGKLESRYEYDKQKILDDKENEKKLALQIEEQEKQKIISASIAGGSILLLIFLLIILNRLNVTRKQKSIIETQKILVEKQKVLVEEKQKEVIDSINYAKRIQAAILPPHRLVREFLPESFILYKPKDIVAGDFYWMEAPLNPPDGGKAPSPSGRAGEGLILFAAADCTGHGVPGAMVSVVCNNALNRSVREYGITDPGKILNKTREIVIQEFEKSDEEVKDGMDISLCAIEALPSSLYSQEKAGVRLHYAGANNPLWIIRSAHHPDPDASGEESIDASLPLIMTDYELLEIKADKQPIGKYAEPKPFTTHTIELKKGDTIYTFTDGYADQFGGPKGKKFKYAQLKELLLSIQNKTMEEQSQILNLKFEEWKGNLEQVDDVCVIGVRL